MDAAFACLHDAIRAGFDRIWAWNDKDLSELKKDKRFLEIVGPIPGENQE